MELSLLYRDNEQQQIPVMTATLSCSKSSHRGEAQHFGARKKLCRFGLVYSRGKERQYHDRLAFPSPG
jgi:hypothetical protein